jgi:hypothetical protein
MAGRRSRGNQDHDDSGIDLGPPDRCLSRLWPMAPSGPGATCNPPPTTPRSRSRRFWTARRTSTRVNPPRRQACRRHRFANPAGCGLAPLGRGHQFRELAKANGRHVVVHRFVLIWPDEKRLVPDTNVAVASHPVVERIPCREVCPIQRHGRILRGRQTTTNTSIGSGCGFQG